VAHDEEPYEITDGNTNKKFIWWDYSASPITFQTSDTAPSIDPTEDLLICFNDTGAAKLAFHTGLIQAEMIVAGIIKGITAIFGSGDEIVCDDDGITLKAGAALPNAVKWVDDADVVRAKIWARGSSAADNEELYLRIYDKLGNLSANISLSNLAGNMQASLLPFYVHRFAIWPPTELTISGGVITVTDSSHIIDTEGDAATDDLDTINGGVDGQILVLCSADNARDPTVKHGTGNIQLDGGADFTLSNIRRQIVLFNRGGSIWRELTRAAIPL